jgi:acyl-homoserine-lactone acylase
MTRPGLRTALWLALVFGTCTAAEPAAAADAKSLAAQVQIRRTAYGVPHIKAESLEAVAFGLAYCQAEDHLPSVMRGIIGTRGELAATFGPDRDRQGDNKNVETDLFNRQFRVYQRAVEAYHQLDPDYRAMCEGFAGGLNVYVERHRDNVPDWTPQVTGHDVVAYGLAGVMRFAFNRGGILNQFLKSQGAETALVDSADDGLVGSNMWAFAPSRSRSGRAILMGNPHQPWAPVSTYYEAHLIVPGKLNFYGSTFIGRPVLTTGWNEHLGWSHTVNYPDLEEIYELELDPERADHYRFDGDSLPMARDDVEIAIQTPTGEETRKRTFWHTPLGPVVHRTPTKAYVLRSACYDDFRAYEQWLRLARSTSYAEFRRVLDANHLPMFNICYADRVGNIFYLWNGMVPKLPHAAHRAEAVPAARTADIWTEFHTTAELPQLFNPPGGYVQNCNSPPFFTTLHAPLDPAAYPPYFPANNVSLRSQHSLSLIHNDKKFTLEEVCDLKHSPRMLLAERVKDDLIAAVRATQPSSELEAALKVLEDWDNRVSAESRGAALFDRWWERYDADGAGKFAVEWSAAEPTATPRGLADNERAVQSFVEALREANERYGRPDASWGETHRIRQGDVDLPVSGGSGLLGCFRALGFRQDRDGKQVANGGDSWVFAVEFSQPPRAYTIVAYSQSEIEGSPHYSDQAALFSANQMKRAAFTEAEIEAQLLKTYRPGEE